MSRSVRVVLNRPRFPENVGMVARACANMGVGELWVVCPELWRKSQALKLATSQGAKILEQMVFVETLGEALSSCNLALGTTARKGGWRKQLLTPRVAAKMIAQAESEDQKVALVFGREDAGLNNSDIAFCSALINIPTSDGDSSLNLAQAVLVVLYEYHCSSVEPTGQIQGSASITIEELERLEREFMQVLELLDCTQGRNPVYHFRQWHQMLVRASLRRPDYNSFMGLFRQIRNKLG